METQKVLWGKNILKEKVTSIAKIIRQKKPNGLKYMMKMFVYFMNF